MGVLRTTGVSVRKSFGTYRVGNAGATKLEVGPGDDLLPRGEAGVHLDGDTETGTADWALGLETLDGLQEAPGGDDTEFDGILLRL